MKYLSLVITEDIFNHPTNIVSVQNARIIHVEIGTEILCILHRIKRLTPRHPRNDDSVIFMNSVNPISLGKFILRHVCSCCLIDVESRFYYS